MRGHIHKRVRKNRSGKETTLWYVVVDIGTDAEGRRRQKWHGGFATRREAEVARAKIVNDLHTGSYVPPDRIMYASDFPHWDHSYPKSVKELADRADLTETQRASILSGTARRF